MADSAKGSAIGPDSVGPWQILYARRGGFRYTGRAGVSILTTSGSHSTPRTIMPRRTRPSLVIASLLICPAAVRADDATLAKQRQTADAQAKSLQLSSIVNNETRHFILYGTLSDGRLKALGATLEMQYAPAVKALQFANDDPPWSGKLAVYDFTERGDYRSFARQVEKRSPDDAELGSFRLSDDVPHVAAGPGKGKDAPTPEVQAGYQLAAALLAARARNVPLPEWVVTGFGKATAAHAAGTSAGGRKRAARNLGVRFKASDVWNDKAPAEVRHVLAVSVADFVFYGKGVPKPVDFLNGFRPDDEKPMKTATDALSASQLTPEQFDIAYRRWLTSNN
jgi:hypothetical protein